MIEVIKTIRRDWKINDTKRDEGLSTPPEIKRFDNICYASDTKWQTLDVYRPKDAQGKLPVLVSVHGGAWVYGDKELYQYYCMDLARRGFAVVNFTYRLCPEFKFPAPLEDTNFVFGWLLQHADEYGFDTDNVFAMGDSAGAHLLGLYLCILGNPEYAANYPFTSPKGLCIKAAILNCGVYDVISHVQEDQDMHAIMQEFLPNKCTRQEQELISMNRHVTHALPPLFITSSTDDFLKNQVPYIVPELCKNNVPFTLKFYAADKAGEPLLHDFQVTIRKTESVRCNNEECDFLRSFVAN